MKRLALLLGSLLVVSSIASAKEVMPAPTPEPEKVIEYVEKPVIVYRDREVAPAWRPNGSVSLTYRWYGETENKNVGEDTDKDWANGVANAGRLQTLTNINFTEKQSLDIRTRNYHTLKSTDRKQSTVSSDSLRLRHFYNFGTLGSSKVKAKSKLVYNQVKGDEGRKTLEASVFFDFADYIPSNEYFKVTSFGLRPKYVHSWVGHNSDGTRDKVGLDFESTYKLPAGFSAELNLYSDYTRNKKEFEVAGGGKKRGQFNGAMEAYLYYSLPLYKNDKFSLTFDAEGGYDSYDFHQYKAKNSTNRRSYSIYLQPTVTASYKATENVKLSLTAGAEYRNFKVQDESEAKNWRWQPTAWAGMKVSF